MSYIYINVFLYNIHSDNIVPFLLSAQNHSLVFWRWPANRCKSLLIDCKLFLVASRCFSLRSRCFPHAFRLKELKFMRLGPGAVGRLGPQCGWSRRVSFLRG